ncbi:MAG: sugar ABC transporter permease [Lachnospiraceae bacterium]|jgi:raffinose/stachyose/melibiose transport system permease protein|nr:sugar ABC transporter permease [Lachnospiraceae bacterium]MCI1727015.1 sugar ABC transporter permease [Lachnospiraceae bacterium]
MNKSTGKALKPKFYEHLFFLGPASIVYCIVILIPFIISIVYSFTDWNGVSNEIKWVGFKNFIDIFTGNSDFLQSFVFTLEVSLINVALVNLLGILLAAALYSKLPFRNGFRLIFYLPNVIGGLILGFIWQFIFVNGLPSIGRLLQSAVLSKGWLGTEMGSFWAIIVVSVWQSMGYVMMVMVAAFTGLPQDMIESARIDGATSSQIFRKIMIPNVMPYITVCLFWTLSSAFKMFELNYSLTKGGPYGTTTSMALNIYNDAFANNKYGLATAESLIFFLIVLAAAVIQLYFSRRQERRFEA